MEGKTNKIDKELGENYLQVMQKYTVENMETVNVINVLSVIVM